MKHEIASAGEMVPGRAVYDPPDPHLGLVSCSRPSPGLTPRDFLRLGRGSERFYWQDRHGSLALAGSGIAVNLMAWGEDRFGTIQEKARALFDDAVVSSSDQPVAGPRLFGGFAFRSDFVPDNTWSVFNPAHFVLPHYQLTQAGKDTWLTINTLVPRQEIGRSDLSHLQEALETRYEVLVRDSRAANADDRRPRVVDVNYPMPYATWEEKITLAKSRMRESELKKVVLARVCEIRLDKRIDVDGVMAYLDEHYADSYRFLFEPRPFHAFFGATPELLADVSGDELNTMALAGSIRRGNTLEEDNALAEQMLADPKERHEHQLVVDSIRRRLLAVAAEHEIPDRPAIFQLSNIQHLYTPIRARIHNPDGVLPLVGQLHPTPALGGSPREQAMAFIEDAEPVPRGWYAAPIGWINHELDGAFAVAIRSAVSQERRVWLYAGSGIVPDSVPEKEWAETALKFKPMLQALGLDEPVTVV